MRTTAPQLALWVIFVGATISTQALVLPITGRTQTRSCWHCCMTESSLPESRGALFKRARNGIFAAAGIAASWKRNGSAEATWAAERNVGELVLLVNDARGKLDPVDGLIDDAKWDAIRTVVKAPPVAELKNIILELSRKPELEEDSGAILGMRQDLLDHLQFLDTFAYNNVFVGEDRQILGTKVDYAIPRSELAQCREAIDTLLDLLPTE